MWKSKERNLSSQSSTQIVCIQKLVGTSRLPFEIAKKIVSKNSGSQLCISFIIITVNAKWVMILHWNIQKIEAPQTYTKLIILIYETIITSGFSIPLHFWQLGMWKSSSQNFSSISISPSGLCFMPKLLSDPGLP